MELRKVSKVSVAIGVFDCMARAPNGGAIVLGYISDFDGSVIHIRSSKVGENGIKPDTCYTLNSDGEFVECEK